MYKITYVDKIQDVFTDIKFLGSQKDEANKAFVEKKNDPWFDEVIAHTMTCEVVFNKSDVDRYNKGEKVQTYTYKAEDEIDPKIYKHVIVPHPQDAEDIKIGYPVKSGYKDQFELAELRKKGNFKDFKEILEALMY